jgi:ABC-type multidrug transport system permease subunit
MNHNAPKPTRDQNNAKLEHENIEYDLDIIFKTLGIFKEFGLGNHMHFKTTLVADERRYECIYQFSEIYAHVHHMKNPEQSLRIARSLLENKLEYLSLRKEFIADLSWYFTFTLICITLFCIYALTNLSSGMEFLTGIGEGINSSEIPENLKPVTFTLLLTTMGGLISGIAFTIKIFLFSGKIDKIKKNEK